MDTTTRIRALAQTAHDAMEVALRGDGSRYHRVKDGAPEWITDMIRDAGHDSADILPDDYRYAFVFDALEIIAESDDEGDAEDRALEWETDVYTSDLLKWAGSHGSRIDYADEALSDGRAKNIDSALRAGQEDEFREVFGAVLYWITEKAKDEDDDEEK